MAGIPNLAETVLLHRDIELLRYTNSRLHITAVSTEEGVNMIRRAKKEGLQITCSVTPYHLALTDDALKEYDSVYKVSPVLRSEKDRQALIKGLKDGTIDCIASHHRPQEWDAKAKEFEYASEGMNVQESAFGIVCSAVGDKIPLERIVEAFTCSPRTIFGLQDAAIAQGNKANLCMFLPEEKFVTTEKEIQSLSRNNPFINKILKGKIVGIIHHQQSFLN
jgi:dihydroorotase